MNWPLPDSVRSYLAASTSAQAERTAQSFAPDGAVHDEHRTHVGPAAIGAWAKDAYDRYRFALEIRNVEGTGDDVAVTRTSFGDLPGQPCDPALRLPARRREDPSPRHRPAGCGGGVRPGKRVLVTGGTQGIGAAVAKRPARGGRRGLRHGAQGAAGTGGTASLRCRRCRHRGRGPCRRRCGAGAIRYRRSRGPQCRRLVLAGWRVCNLDRRAMGEPTSMPICSPQCGSTAWLLPRMIARKAAASASMSPRSSARCRFMNRPSPMRRPRRPSPITARAFPRKSRPRASASSASPPASPRPMPRRG